MCSAFLRLNLLRFRVVVLQSRPAGVAAAEYRTNSDVTIVRCTSFDPYVSRQNARCLCIINWQVLKITVSSYTTYSLSLTPSYLVVRLT